jgi:hypothetical protein
MLEANKGEAEKCKQIAMTAYSTGDCEKAARFLQKAKRMCPDDASVDSLLEKVAAGPPADATPVGGGASAVSEADGPRFCASSAATLTDFSLTTVFVSAGPDDEQRFFCFYGAWEGSEDSELGPPHRQCMKYNRIAKDRVICGGSVVRKEQEKDGKIQVRWKSGQSNLGRDIKKSLNGLGEGLSKDFYELKDVPNFVDEEIRVKIEAEMRTHGRNAKGCFEVSSQCADALSSKRNVQVLKGAFEWSRLFREGKNRKILECVMWCLCVWMFFRWATNFSFGGVCMCTLVFTNIPYFVWLAGEYLDADV